MLKQLDPYNEVFSRPSSAPSSSSGRWCPEARQGESTIKPVLDPEKDLIGATPETLARALFRRVVPPLQPGTRRKAVVRDEVTKEKPTTDKAGNSVSHLDKRP